MNALVKFSGPDFDAAVRVVREQGVQPRHKPYGRKKADCTPEQWAAHLEHPKRIVIRPTPPALRKPDGRIDWAEVRRVTVVEFVDYH